LVSSFLPVWPDGLVKKSPNLWKKKPKNLDYDYCFFFKNLSKENPIGENLHNLVILFLTYPPTTKKLFTLSTLNRYLICLEAFWVLIVDLGERDSTYWHIGIDTCLISPWSTRLRNYKHMLGLAVFVSVLELMGREIESCQGLPSV
jgi:superfamily I DNA and/or RNA helicase